MGKILIAEYSYFSMLACCPVPLEKTWLGLSYLLILIEPKALWPQDNPQTLPLAHCAFDSKALEIAVANNSLWIAEDTQLLAATYISRLELLSTHRSRGRQILQGTVGLHVSTGVACRSIRPLRIGSNLVSRVVL